MKSIMLTTALIAATALSSCNSKSEADGNIIDKPAFESTDGVFSIDALEALGRVSGPCVSPDGTKVLYGVSYELV